MNTHPLLNLRLRFSLGHRIAEGKVINSHADNRYYQESRYQSPVYVLDEVHDPKGFVEILTAK